MKNPQKIVFGRHGQYLGNVMTDTERANHKLFTHDMPLTASGQSQTLATAAYIEERFPKFDGCFHSSFVRARHTAWSFKYQFCEDVRLNEIDRGVWIQMSAADVMKYYPGEALRKQRCGLYYYQPIGGESWFDAELRVHAFLQFVRDHYAGKNILLIGHGNWFLLFRKVLENKSVAWLMQHYHGQGSLANAGVAVFRAQNTRLGEKLALESLNIVPWMDKS